MKQLIISCFVGIFLVLAPTTMNAHEIINYLFGVDFDLAYINNKSPVYVEVNDRVTGGCWLTVAAAESKVKRELLEAGFSNLVDDITSDGINIFIKVMGFETTAYSCAASPNLAILGRSTQIRGANNEKVEWSSFYTRHIYAEGSLLIGPKSGMSARINSEIESYIDDFIVQLHQEKQKLFEKVSETDTEDVYKVPLLNAAAPLKR